MPRDETAIRQVLDEGAFTTLFHPIFSLATGELISVEALTRITLDPIGSPAWWLSEAHTVGLGVELELLILLRALDRAAALPEHLALSVNLSPSALAHPPTLSVLLGAPVAKLVVELTEQPSMHVHPQLLRQREALREARVELAVGNVAARRPTMARLLALKPDQVKTDLWLTADIDRDPTRRILARKLLRVAHHARAEVVAEGIETPEQLATWRQLGADAAQGFLLGMPAQLDEALRTSSIRLP
jgi:EAL domain-containing protein (putative c-di-GMP-specific phosphodiesterase class I)